MFIHKQQCDAVRYQKQMKFNFFWVCSAFRRDGWERRNGFQTPSRLRWLGWDHPGWYMDSSGHFLPTPEWPKTICTLGTKCPWAAIKSCAPATRGWNLHHPVRLHASCRIRGPAATLWPLLRHRTPAAKHCGTYKKLKQDTFMQAWLRCSNASRTCRASKPKRQESVRSKSLPDAREHDTAISALMAWCYVE